jgi:hypothetical protein
MTEKRSAWSLTFDTADEASRGIRECAYGFYFIAGLQAVFSLVVGTSTLTDAALFALLAFWLHRRQSAVAAVLLLLLASASVLVTAYNKFGGGQGGGNIVLSVIVFWAGLRAVTACQKLRAFRKDEREMSVAMS